MEVLLLNDQTKRVLLRCHHSATDGQGALHFLSEIFRALRKEPLIGSAGKDCDWDIAKRVAHSTGETSRKLSIPMANRSENPKLRSNNWIRFHLTGNQTDILPIVILAAARIARRLQGEGNVTIRIPSDLRRFLPKDAPRTMANAIGAFDLEIPTEATPQSIRAQLNAQKADNQDLAAFDPRSWLIPWLPTRWFWPKPRESAYVHRRGTYRSTGTVSFVGKVDLSNFSHDQFKASHLTLLPIGFESRPFFLGMIKTEHGVDASLGMPQALANPAQLRKIANQLQAEINRIITDTDNNSAATENSESSTTEVRSMPAADSVMQLISA
jgi:hypothetical protein